MKTNIAFQPDGLCPVSERGSMAKKVLLQFHAEIWIDDKLAWVCRGLRVGAGQIFNACGRGGRGNKYYSIVEIDKDVMVPLLQPVFEVWAKEYPTVIFPSEVKKKELTKDEGPPRLFLFSGTPVDTQPEVKASVVSQPARPFPPPKPHTVGPDHNRFTNQVLEWSVDRIRGHAIYYDPKGTLTFGCGPCYEDPQPVTMEQALTRVCAKGQHDHSNAPLAYGIDAQGVMHDTLK